MVIDKLLVQAVEAHQAGRREEAEKLYRKILLKRPRATSLRSRIWAVEDRD
jgi:hypothetical protein